VIGSWFRQVERGELTRPGKVKGLNCIVGVVVLGPDRIEGDDGGHWARGRRIQGHVPKMDNCEVPPVCL